MDSDADSSFRKGFYLFFSITFFIILSCSPPGQKLYYRLHPVWTRSFTPTIADLNGDGKDELIINRGEQTDVMDWKLRYYYYSFRISLNVPFYCQAIPTTNIDSLYFLISFIQSDTSYAKILQPMPQTQGQSIPPGMLKDFYSYPRSALTPPPDFHQTFSFVKKFTNKSKNEYSLFQFNCSWDKYGKRGLFAADIGSQKIVWQYYTGPQIYKIIIKDINANGADEIILGTYSPNNGVRGASTKDDSSYVITLNAEGRPLWKRSFGPFWSGALVDIGYFEEGNGKILVCQKSYRDLPSYQDKVFLLDPLTGKTLAVRAIGDRLSAPLAVLPDICRDFNGDGKDEIVLGNSDGTVRMLDGNLSEIKSSKNFGMPIFVSAVEDLDSDGTLEIVCYIPEEKIVVLDNSLNEMCSYPILFKGSLPTVHTGAEPCLLASYTINGNNQTSLLKLEKSIIPFPVADAAKRKLTAGIAAFFLLSLALLFWYGKKRFDNQFLTVIAQNELSDKLVLLTRSGRIKYIGDQWAQILGIHYSQILGGKIDTFLQNDKFSNLKNAMQDLIHGKQIEQVVFISNNDNGEDLYRLTIRNIRYPKLYSLMLFDQNEKEYFKQVHQWAQVAQRLAHGIKNPLTAVKLNAEELDHFLKEEFPSREEETGEYLSAITEQVDRLKRMSDGFMRFVDFKKSVLRPADINELIKDAVAQCFPGKSLKISIEYDLADNLPNALLDEKQFEEAFRNIFFNAVESFDEKGGRIIISTRLVQLLPKSKNMAGLHDYIELQIQDTGKGIPPGLLNKIIQPYVSSKTGGTGLGLSIVQKVMDSHGGEFHITSQEGVMTTVTLRFQAEIKKDI